MSNTENSERASFFSLPRELRQKILLDVFPWKERQAIIDHITLNQPPIQDSRDKHETDSFWRLQQQGWIVSSICSATLPEIKKSLEDTIHAEVACRYAPFMRLDNILDGDMDYVRERWSVMLKTAINVWCEEFKRAHKQLKGAGPGANNFWWIPSSEDENWYHSLLDAPSS